MDRGQIGRETVSPAKPRHLQRVVLSAFLVTFVCARIIVLLIMSRDIPDLYAHLGGTHVHHLNYGIFLLSIVGALLLFAPPAPRWLDSVAAAYGAGLALTFDEFGMWLNLGGSYWQRDSFDAVIVVGGLLLLAAFTPPVKSWTRRRFVATVIGSALLGVFFWRLSISLHGTEHKLGQKLENLEQAGPR